MAFSRQLSSFLEAGIPVLDALEIVAQQTGVAADADRHHRHPGVDPPRHQLRRCRRRTPRRVPGVLPGDAGVGRVHRRSRRGAVQLSEYLERDIAAKRQVKSALTYPIIVLVVAFVAMIVMSVFVLPKFTGLYSSLGADFRCRRGC